MWTESGSQPRAVVETWLANSPLTIETYPQRLRIYFIFHSINHIIKYVLNSILTTGDTTEKKIQPCLHRLKCLAVDLVTKEHSHLFCFYSLCGFFFNANFIWAQNKQNSAVCFRIYVGSFLDSQQILSLLWQISVFPRTNTGGCWGHFPRQSTRFIFSEAGLYFLRTWYRNLTNLTTH